MTFFFRPSRYNAVWIIFFILGLGTLLPWNFFMTATMVGCSEVSRDEPRWWSCSQLIKMEAESDGQFRFNLQPPGLNLWEQQRDDLHRPPPLLALLGLFIFGGLGLDRPSGGL